MKWALKLSAYRNVIELLPGDQNVWTDMLTRWAVSRERRVKTARIGHAFYEPVNPSGSDAFDSPSLTDVERSQRNSSEVPPKISAH